MRPRTLVMENFGSFRGRHEVDFTDVDLFVLAGPTGAGKSTVIDAITMALYGAVARYDNRTLIEPAINKLATQAKVSLRFAADGHEYVVTRVLRRTSTGGASSPEVRLELAREGDQTTPLASGAREVNKQVEQRLGLTFDEFCKTVVLPQGAFATFLHGNRQERQDLLVRLLGLRMYAEVGQAARSRSQALEHQIDMIDTALTRLGEVDQDKVDAAEQHAESLTQLRDRVLEELWPQLEELTEAVTRAQQAKKEAGECVKALDHLQRPAGIEELGERVRKADATRGEANKTLGDARKTVEEAREAQQEAGDPAPLEHLLSRDAELDTQLQRLTELREAAEAAASQTEEAKTEADAAEAAATAADEEVQRLERTDLAHTLSEGLAIGDDCPVCLRPIKELLDHTPPEGLDHARHLAREAHAEAQRLREEATTKATDTAKFHARVESTAETIEGLRQEIAEVAEKTNVGLSDGRIDRADVEERLAGCHEAAKALRDAEAKLTDAEKRLEEAVEARNGLEEEISGAWRTFTAARDTVAALGAPTVDRDDVARAWDELLAWATERLDQASNELQAAGDALSGAQKACADKAGEIRSLVIAAEVDVPEEATPQQVLDRLSTASEAAAARHRELRDKLEQAKDLAEERGNAADKQQVAGMLGRLLQRNAFEQWLLNRLSRRLVAAASRTLAELTQNAFSLALDEHGAFEVIDHLNADERRSAKTLSGGETFLASLALALALAEHVATISQPGATRMEALFLDEGFGTLDPETLETVATAIEELSSARMVGVITHVRELAARMPVRFDVHRGPDGSQIRPVTPDDTAALTDLEAAR
jgi:DNA repair protein SbcC/Rad50